MCGTTRGEQNSPGRWLVRMFGISSVQKPSEGASFFPSRFAGWVDEEERKLIDTLWRRRGGVSRLEEACERRSGEISIKAFVRDPGREKPKGASSGRRTKHTLDRQGLSKGSKPRNRSSPSRPLCFTVHGYIEESTVRGFNPSRKRPGYLSRGERSEGEIPRALLVRNKTGKALKGVNRQEGNQTLKAEDGGRW
jgi:hypothetical protein